MSDEPLTLAVLAQTRIDRLQEDIRRLEQRLKR